MSEISKFVDHSTRLKLVRGSVLSRLDYYNSLYIGLPDSELRFLQMILNSAARIVRQLPRFSREHITPICIELHFLPIKARIKYKICLLAFKALTLSQPIYIRNMLTFKNWKTSMNLTSTDRQLLEAPFLSGLVSVRRCFSYTAPRLYNTLDEELKRMECLDGFKNKLKTSIFREAYDLGAKTINVDFRV